MKSLKSILDMDLIQVDWKNIIRINNIGDKSENKEGSDELQYLFV